MKRQALYLLLSILLLAVACKDDDNPAGPKNVTYVHPHQGSWTIGWSTNDWQGQWTGNGTAVIDSAGTIKGSMTLQCSNLAEPCGSALSGLVKADGTTTIQEYYKGTPYNWLEGTLAGTRKGGDVYCCNLKHDKIGTWTAKKK